MIDFKKELFSNAFKQRIPLIATIEIISQCNFRCVHCYIENKCRKDILTFEEIEDFGNQIIHMGCLYVVLTGGEVLLHPDFERIYLFFVQKGVCVSVFTNGSLINNKIINLFTQYPPRVVEITMYGFNQDTYKLVTKKNLFENVKKVDKLEGDKDCKVEIINEYAHAYFSKDKSFFELADGSALKVTSDEIVLCGECFDIKRISEELNGPSIIMGSRYHKRAVLHGSAFLYKEKAYLILANPGAGKSTLTTAMVKYHNEISFLTDDIISVAEDGKIMFKGIHLVNLNDDSLNELFSQHLHNEVFLEKGGLMRKKLYVIFKFWIQPQICKVFKLEE